MANWTPNEKAKTILACLAKAEKPMTLAEISKEVGFEVKTGTTNTLVSKGLMICHKDAIEKVCPCCKRKSKVSTYELVKA